MLKRGRDGDGDGDGDEDTKFDPEMSLSFGLAHKRRKLGQYSSALPASNLALVSDRLTSLPHELIIRILHLLPFKCVLLCQLVSRRMRRLAGDAQVWKGLYYERFVRPRAMRLRGISGNGRIPGTADRSDGSGRDVDGKMVKESYNTGEDKPWQKKRSRGVGGHGHENGRKGTRNHKPIEIPVFSSRESKWLDEWWLLGDESGSAEQSGRETGRVDHRDDAGTESGNGKGMGRKRIATDWKARYKLRYNWSIGAAEVNEISLCPSLDGDIEDAEEKEALNRESKSFIARLGDGVVITVNMEHGLRAWDLKTKKCVAQGKFIVNDEESNEDHKVPTCLAVDGTPGGEGTGILVGFRNGHFEVWSLGIGDDGQRSFERQLESPNGQRGDELIGVAYAYPHLLTITASQVLSVYIIDRKDASAAESPTVTGELQDDVSIPNPLDTSYVNRGADPKRQLDDHGKQPRLLTSLRSHTSWPPLYLSIRSTPHSIIASIAYSLPTYLSGWSVGLQELHLTPSGSVLKSRLTSAIEQGFHSLLSTSPSSTPPPTLSSSLIHDGSVYHHSGSVTRRAPHPTSLSYSHPYLLAGNRDNTLTLYLVTSNNEELKISKGTTLWGHTSSVSGAQVGGRGKAVSISARGDELRIWELEAGLGKKMAGERSVRVRRDDRDERTETADTREWISRMAETEDEDRYTDNGWVGFDDEVIIVLRGGGLGDGDGDGNEQKLVVYDFT